MTDDVIPNDNRHPDEYWIKQHPRLSHLPDLGFEFDQETDAYFRAKAEEHDIDYDELKRTLALSYQVIPEQPLRLATQLNEQHIIPINDLKAFMESYLYGMIMHQERHKK